VKRLRVAWLADGKRLHLLYGALDLIIQAFGRPAELGRAYEAGIERARALLFDLEDDVPRLRAGELPESALGQRIAAAIAAQSEPVPPIAVLSGAVADELLGAMAGAGALDRAFVNNRGMVSFHLAEGQGLVPAAMDWPSYHRYEVTFPVNTAMRSRGLAASGWGHDGLSLGWLNRIHVAADSAALAAACLAGISMRTAPLEGGVRQRADILRPGSELGALPVFGPTAEIAPEVAAHLLAQGRETAQALFDAGVINLAAMELDEQYCLVSPPHFSLKAIMGLDN
jgi:uncharacterized protein